MPILIDASPSKVVQLVSQEDETRKVVEELKQIGIERERSKGVLNITLSPGCEGEDVSPSSQSPCHRRPQRNGFAGGCGAEHCKQDDVYEKLRKELKEMGPEAQRRRRVQLLQEGEEFQRKKLRDARTAELQWLQILQEGEEVGRKDVNEEHEARIVKLLKDAKSFETDDAKNRTSSVPLLETSLFVDEI